MLCWRTSRAEWAGLRTQVEEIERTAAESNRDLEEPEQANVDALVSRAEQLRPRIEHLVGQEAGFSATAEALSRVTQGGGTLTTRAAMRPRWRCSAPCTPRPGTT